MGARRHAGTSYGILSGITNLAAPLYQHHPTPSGATMKLARLFLAVLTISTLAACGDSITEPQATPAATPADDEIQCEYVPGTTQCRSPILGSGG
jgi:hypothetical protein